MTKTDMLIVGGDGDLALRKLYPSLYYLELNDCMPEGTRIIGSARTAQSQEEFLAKVEKWLKENVKKGLYNEEKWQRLASRLTFAQGDATNPESLKAIEEKHLDSDAALVVYLAIPPMIFGKVCSALDACGLAKDTTRLVVEKPLGDSEESFLAINAELARVFPEEQLFRIDHYLGKETVQNLLALRFANDIFEPLWNANHIDHIQITVSEEVGVGNRWDFYNQTGATRDMVQNHLLQVLCLTCMEPPAKLDADSVRTEKLKVLKSLKMIGAKEVHHNTVRGQYTAGEKNGETMPGYLEEESDKYEIDPNSQTETFVAIKAEIQNWRWSGVPIYLRTGKRLASRHSEITIHFRKKKHNIFSENHENHASNRMVIRLQPDEGIRLRVMSKVAGLDAGIPLESGCLNMFFAEKGEQQKHDAYSRLIFDVLRNDQTLFVSAPEVQAAWQWVDQIFKGWEDTGMRVQNYPAGSLGPNGANVMLARDGNEWHEIDTL